MNTLKKLLLTGAVAFGAAMFSSSAQPFYAPSSGLIAWYPFNGNADNDVSSLYHGAVNGATLTVDRFGASNSAYYFDGVDDYIDFGSSILNAANQATVSCWIKTNDSGSRTKNVWQKRRASNGDGFLLFLVNDHVGAGLNRQPFVSASPYVTSANVLDTNWMHIVVVNDNGLLTLYVNGLFESSISLSAGSLAGSEPLYVGKGFDFDPDGNGDRVYDGNVDDIGIWDRPLSDSEIWDLYRGCTNSVITSQPVDQIKNIGTNATFSFSTIVTPISYVWETDFGLGYQSLFNVGQYSGAFTSSLTVSNVQLRNHYQPFRCIVNISNQCIGTTDVAQIILVDTCITTVYDTVQVSQSSMLTNLIESKSSRYEVSVSPNPSNGQLKITNNIEDFNSEKYEVKIFATDGRLMLSRVILSNVDYVDLKENTSPGVYFVIITNSSNQKIAAAKVLIK